MLFLYLDIGNCDNYSLPSFCTQACEAEREGVLCLPPPRKNIDLHVEVKNFGQKQQNIEQNHSSEFGELKNSFLAK